MDDKKPSLNIINKLLKDNWENEGYDSKKHETERFKQAEKIIKDFYQSESKSFSKPLAIEQPFNFILKNGVKVFGKIDRIDKKDYGIEIIDYKTGLNNPKAERAHKLQLAIYALAAIRVKDIIFAKDYKNISLSLYFLEENKRKTLEFETKELDSLEDQLIEKVAEIEKSDFKCSGNIICKNCEFKMLCSAI